MLVMYRIGVDTKRHCIPVNNPRIRADELAKILYFEIKAWANTVNTPMPSPIAVEILRPVRYKGLYLLTSEGRMAVTHGAKTPPAAQWDLLGGGNEPQKELRRMLYEVRQWT